MQNDIELELNLTKRTFKQVLISMIIPLVGFIAALFIDCTADEIYDRYWILCWLFPTIFLGGMGISSMMFTQWIKYRFTKKGNWLD